MATESSKLKVGLFLIAGFLLFNGALVWIGASHVLEKTSRFVTYFDESVHGLDVGAAVKYRGVAIGRVGSIRVAPDGRLVEVGLDIAREFRAAPGLRASLSSSGITGISVLELGFPPAGAPPPPELSFSPPERYLPSQPSLLASLTAALTDLAVGLRGVDLRTLVEDYRAAAVAARRRLAAPEIDRALAGVAEATAALEALGRQAAGLAADPRLTGMLDRFNAAAERMEGAAQSAQALLADPRIPQTLEEARAAAAVLRRSADEIRAELSSLRAGERLDAVQLRVEATLDGIGESGRTAAAGALETAEAGARAAARWERLAAGLERSLREVLGRLERAAGSLEALATSLEASPSRLLEKPQQEDFR